MKDFKACTTSFTVESTYEHDEGGDRGGFMSTNESVEFKGKKAVHSWSSSHDEEDGRGFGFGEADFEPSVQSLVDVVAVLKAKLVELAETTRKVEHLLTLATSAEEFETDYGTYEDEEDEEEDEDEDE